MNIGRALALKLFEAFFIQRWTDVIRPVELVEMDKSAEKMVVTYLLGKYEEQMGHEVDWVHVIYGGLFDLLTSIAMSDIKAPVREMIKQEAPEEFDELKQWVIDQYKPLISDERLMDEFKAYTYRTETRDSVSDQILAAAHQYVTLREFQLIKPVNPPTARLIREEENLVGRLREFLHLDGLQRLMTMQTPYEFLTIVEQLRNQVRWSQTPRMPMTSVLGHSYYVAILTLLMLREQNPCPKRTFNTFFAALFHDLPEAVTRDIISPVKSATESFPSVIKRIEAKVVERDLLPTMDTCFKDELLYFTTDEFTNRILVDNKACPVPFEELNVQFNEDKHDPIDGKLIEVADHMAAFVEAERSISHGVTSEHLKNGRKRIKDTYSATRVINGVRVWEFYNQFAD